jgi:hypothetical protein
MKLARLSLPLCLVLLCGISAVAAGGNANFVLGGRSLDEDLWAPVEDQPVFGATVDFGKKGWPVQLAAGAMFSGADDHVRVDVLGVTRTAKFTVTVAEASFGVLKIWEPSSGNIRPYVGGGAAFVSASAELEVSGASVDDDDQSAGLYAQGGVFWRLGERFNIGVDARVLGGTDIEVFGASGDVDYFQVGLVLGWGWR